jgi:hypothetical protein
MHPLTPDLEKLTDEELHTKLSELQTRLNYAYRIGSADMVNQLQLIIMDYGYEVERRNQKMLESAQKSGRLGGDSDAKDITR